MNHKHKAVQGILKSSVNLIEMTKSLFQRFKIMLKMSARIDIVEDAIKNEPKETYSTE